MAYNTITYENDDIIARITLNRPDVRNAMNPEMVDELRDVFSLLAKPGSNRAIVLSGNGSAFCAGADLNWLTGTVGKSFEQNYDEGKRLAQLLYEIHEHPLPVIAKVNGAAIGGGAGLVLASDIAVAGMNVRFGLSEVAYGIVPAAIVPFLIGKAGETFAREKLITGERVDAEEAEAAGIVNYAVPAGELDERINAIIDKILKNGPRSLKLVKRLINFSRKSSKDETVEYVAEMIADFRSGDECLEGVSAFLAKRTPSWALDIGKEEL